MRIVFLIVLHFGVIGESASQGLVLKYDDFLLNIGGMQLVDDDIYLSGIYGDQDGTHSIYFSISDTKNYSQLDTFAMTIGGVFFHNNKPYVFGKNRSNPKSLCVGQWQDSDELQPKRIVQTQGDGSTAVSYLQSTDTIFLNYFWKVGNVRKAGVALYDIEEDHLVERILDYSDYENSNIWDMDYEEGILYNTILLRNQGEIQSRPYLVKYSVKEDEETLLGPFADNYNFSRAYNVLVEDGVKVIQFTKKYTDPIFFLEHYRAPPYLAFFDENDNLVSDSLFLTGAKDELVFNEMIQTTDSTFVVLGYKEFEDDPAWSGYMAYFNFDGTMLWDNTYRLDSIQYEESDFHVETVVNYGDNLLVQSEFIDDNGRVATWLFMIDHQGDFVEHDWGQYVSTDELLPQSSMPKIIPNPASRRIELTNCDNCQISIYNLAGEVVFHNLGSQHDINLLPGLYFALIIDGGEQFLERLVIH